MRRTHFYLGTGYAGAEYTETVEFPDDATDEEIDEEYTDWMGNCLDFQWWEED